MKRNFKVKLLSILVMMGTMNAYALKVGDIINYATLVSNQSSENVLADGVVIAPNQTEVVVHQFKDTITQQVNKFAHAVNVTTPAGVAICTVTGHVDITLPGSFSMYSENTNTSSCSKSNGMNGGLTNLVLDITVLNDKAIDDKIFIKL